MASRISSSLPLALLFSMIGCCIAEEEKTVKVPRFDPVELDMEGWKVHVEPSLLEGGEYEALGGEVLKMLRFHLFFITRVVPKERVEELKTCEIWVEHHHPKLGAMQYHPGVGWLKNHGHDPRLWKKVHIPRAAALIDRGQLMKHPMAVLHELVHAYHHQFLGFDDARIIAAYEAAKKSGNYKNTLLYTGQRVLHYGMSNPMEYFAEGTEAYFNRNDFFPFVRAELKEHDPGFHDLLEEIWGRVQ